MKNHKGSRITPKQETVSIPEAIELSKEAVASLKKGNFPLHAKAVQLGIDALERVKECCLTDHTIAEDYLPGETPGSREGGK